MGLIGLELRLCIFLKVFVAQLNILYENAKLIEVGVEIYSLLLRN
jgi:hypothetical protein